MTSRALLIVLAIAAGMGQPFQTAMNSRLREALQAPPLAALVSLLVSSVLVGAATVSGLFGRGTLQGITMLPWWAWFGGVIGACSLTINLTALPKVSAAGTISAAIVGQLLAAIVVDHFGWLGAPHVPFSITRVAGVAFLVAGLVLILRW